MNIGRSALIGLTLAAVFAAAPTSAADDVMATVSTFFGDIRVGGNVRLDGTAGQQMLAFGGNVGATGTTSDTLGVAGGKVDLDSVTADRVYAAGGTISLTGVKADELFAAGGSVVVTDTRVSNGHFAGGSVVVAGEFAGDLHASGGTISVAGGTAVSGDTIAVGGDVALAGQFKGDVGVKAQSARIGGTIDGDLSVAAAKIILDPGTTVAGDMIVPAGVSFAPPPGVTISGEVRNDGELDEDGVKVRIAIDDADDGGLSMSPFGSGLITTLVSLAAFGALVLGIAPQFMARAAQQMAQRPMPSLAVGLSSLFLAPLAMALAAVTVIGIPFALLGAAAYAVGIALGVVTLCLWGGLAVRAATKQPGNETRLPRLVGWTLMGFIGLAVVGAIPVLGGIVQLLAVMTGAGAIIVTAWAARQPSAA